MSKEKVPQVAISMLSLIGPETPYLPYSRLGTYTKIADTAEAGLDFWPIGPIPTWFLYYGLVSNKDLVVIKSASSSFRSEKTLFDSIKHKNKKVAIPAFFILPHKDDTIALTNIWRLVRGTENIDETRRAFLMSKGPQIPIVLDFDTVESNYLEKQLRPQSYKATSLDGVNPKVVQATQDLFERFSLQTEPQLDAFLAKFNLKGFCFNTIESRFLMQNPELLAAVLRRTMLIYVKVFRTDGSDPKLSFSQGLDLINKSKNTDIYEMLDFIRKVNPGILFVIITSISEVPKNKHGKVFLSPDSVGIAVKPLVDGIKAIA